MNEHARLYDFITEMVQNDIAYRAYSLLEPEIVLVSSSSPLSPCRSMDAWKMAKCHESETLLEKRSSRLSLVAMSMTFNKFQ